MHIGTYRRINEKKSTNFPLLFQIPVSLKRQKIKFWCSHKGGCDYILRRDNHFLPVLSAEETFHGTWFFFYTTLLSKAFTEDAADINYLLRTILLTSKVGPAQLHS
jgi:hypothetical protein